MRKQISLSLAKTQSRKGFLASLRLCERFFLYFLIVFFFTFALALPVLAQAPIDDNTLDVAKKLNCPTCGGLRAVHRLLHGEFRAAYALNPFLFWFLPVAGLLAVRPLRARAPWLLWAALAALIAWFLWKNYGW